MKCPFCKSNQVFQTNSKEVSRVKGVEISATRRYRKCESCKKSFTTYEFWADSEDFRVFKAMKILKPG